MKNREIEKLMYYTATRSVGKYQSIQESHPTRNEIIEKINEIIDAINNNGKNSNEGE